MTSTHTSLYYHLIFSTKYRHPWIREPWDERLHSYLGGIIRGVGGVADCIGGDIDHVHILASLKATHRLADVLRKVKSSSSEWVHTVIGISEFWWQDGYGAFTAGSSELESLRHYIRNQKEHHRKRTFQEEYLELLKQSGVEFDERYLW